MKKIIFIGICLITAAYFVPASWFKGQEKPTLKLGAPSTQPIIPISNSIYDLGTTTKMW